MTTFKPGDKIEYRHFDEWFVGEFIKYYILVPERIWIFDKNDHPVIKEATYIRALKTKVVKTFHKYYLPGTDRYIISRVKWEENSTNPWVFNGTVDIEFEI